MMKLALLSNINADFILQILAGKVECVPPCGFGDVWGPLLDPDSRLNREDPDVIVILIDIERLMDGCGGLCRGGKAAIDEWFAMFDSNIHRGIDYFISDVMFRSDLLTDYDSFLEDSLTGCWMDALEKRVRSHSNVHPLRLNREIIRAGKEKVFSGKMWYMGKIPYTNEGCRIIAEAIGTAVSLLGRTPKKVLALDLDNTLWGGVLGELGVEGISLSDEHTGAVYKRVQQQIMAIKETGILLAVISKNNIQDVREVWDKHPHMVLKEDCFSAIRINWKDKVENILEISKELNLGTDSFVFIDDMDPERDNIRLRLPEVAVPDFPQKIEDYPDFITDVYNKYFKRLRLSADDKAKTRQYAENALRQKASQGLTYEDFLMSLDMVVEKVTLNDEKLDRIAQLHGKTNQFNLTTMRYSRHDIDRLLQNGCKIYAYNVRDKFGDYGLVAVAIVDCGGPEIISFLMSCRVMGKLIENYVIDDVEQDLLKAGYKVLYAKYVKTEKNVPVSELFDRLGYSVTAKNGEETRYRISLGNRPKRRFFVNQDKEEVRNERDNQ